MSKYDRLRSWRTHLVKYSPHDSAGHPSVRAESHVNRLALSAGKGQWACIRAQEAGFRNTNHILNSMS